MKTRGKGRKPKAVPTRLTQQHKKFLELVTEQGLGAALEIMDWDEVKINEYRTKSLLFDKRYLEAMGISKRQEDFLNMYLLKTGNTAEICKSLGITRQTFYFWKATNDKFVEYYKDVEESLKDFGESILFKNMMEGKEQSTIFFLKTKAKDRGYEDTPKVQVTQTNTQVQAFTPKKKMSGEEMDAKIAELKAFLESKTIKKE